MEECILKTSKTLKERLKGTGLISRINRKPNRDGEYSFRIGKVSGTLRIVENRMEIRTNNMSPEHEVDNRALPFFLKEMVANSGTTLGTIRVRTTSAKAKDVIQTLTSEGLVELKKEMTDLVPLRSQVFYSNWQDVLVNEYKTLVSFHHFFVKKAKSTPAFKADLRNGNYLWGFSYYHKGYEGTAKLNVEQDQIFLVDDTLKFRRRIEQGAATLEALEALLCAAEDHVGIKNLVAPNNHLIKCRFEKASLPEDIADAVFAQLLLEQSFEELEPLIPEAHLHKIKPANNDVAMYKFLECLFIIEPFSIEKNLELFSVKDQELAFSRYAERCIESTSKKVEKALKNFKAEIFY